MQEANGVRAGQGGVSSANVRRRAIAALSLSMTAFAVLDGAAADQIVGSTFVDFEVGTDGTALTTQLITSATRGNKFDGWSVSGGSGLIISTAAGFPVYTPVNVGGTLYSTPGTRGLRAIMSGTSVAELSIPAPGYQLSVGFHFRFNGAQINSSPRDVVGLRSDPTGNYQFLQIYDGATPYFHAHWQPGGSGIGNNIQFQRNHWYWVTMNHVAGGNSTKVSFYDAENGYSLVGTSTGAVSSGTAAATTIQIGAIKYSAGGSQSVDFDNFVINTSGVFPLGPGTGGGPVPNPPTNLSVIDP